MASISSELQQIRSASLARDVRSSIATAIEKVNSNTSSGGGDSIDAVTTYYCASSSCTAAPATTASWSTSKPSLTESSCYMWMKLRIAMESGSAVDTPAFVVGNYNSRLSSVTAYYKLTNTTSAPSTGATGWTTTYNAPTASNQYLYCHIRFTYYAYGASSSHTVYSSVFRLATYQAPVSSGEVSGMVLESNGCGGWQCGGTNVSGTDILSDVQKGLMPVMYISGFYAPVICVESTTQDGMDAIRMWYYYGGCSTPSLTSTTVVV